MLDTWRVPSPRNSQPQSVAQLSTTKKVELPLRKKVFEDIKEEEEIFTSSVDDEKSQSLQKQSRLIISD